MGIRGLKSFVECNSQLLVEHKLHDSFLVIDGNNLLHHLYFDSGISFVHGGDYKAYADSLRQFFLALSKCKIVPLVIFDGGYTIDDRKKKTVYSRAKNKNHVLKELSVGIKPTTKILPILAQETLISVMKDMDIVFTQCDFEADNEISVISNNFKCPVLSQDSDFYIYDIPYGFIPIDTLFIEPTLLNEDDKVFYLSCKIFYIDNFMSYFPELNKNLLPIFSTLLGNDYADASLFNSFFAQIPNIPKFKSRKAKKYLIIGKRFAKMIALLEWLEGKTADKAIESVVKCLKKSASEKAVEIIEKVSYAYKDESCSCLKYLCEVYNMSEAKCQIGSGTDLPEWFMEKFRSCFFPSQFMNVFGVKRVILPTLIECITFNSAHVCSIHLRKNIYSILNMIKSVDIIHEHFRDGGNLKKFELDISKSDLKFGSDFGRNGIIDEQGNHFYRILKVSKKFESSFPPAMSIIFLSIVYWINNASPLVIDQHFNAVLLSILYFGCIVPLSEDNTCSLFEGGNAMWASVKESDVHTAKSNMKKFTQNKVFYDVKIIHNYCQLQSCLSFSIQLKRLLLRAEPNSLNIITLNGSFIHNLAHDLAGRSNPDLYINELLSRDGVICKLFFKMRELIMTEVPAEKLITKGVSLSRGKSRKKKKKISTPIPHNDKQKLADFDVDVLI